MDPYSNRVDLIFPKTVWMDGPGDMWVILTAIGDYLENPEYSSPDYEYLNTCDLYFTGRPTAESTELFNRVYLNTIAALNGRGVLDSKVISRENCFILELLCNHKLNISYSLLHL